MAGRNAYIALETEGLKESLGQLDHLAKLDAQRTLRKEFKTLAETAEAHASANARTPGQRKAAQALQASASATSASLRYGAGFPGAMGFEFGAGRNQHRLPRVQKRRSRYSSHTAKGWMLGWNQFQPWKGSGTGAGYFVWPGIRAAVEELVPQMAETLGRIFEGREVPGNG